MSRRPARLDPDSLPVLVFAVVVSAALALVSFALSYAGLVHVAAWAAVPPALAWAVPVVVDGAQLVFTAAALVHRARGEAVASSWAALGLFAAVSVTGNALHAWDVSQGGWRGWAGVVVAGLAPLAVVLSVHELASLVVASPAAQVAAETLPEGHSETVPALLADGTDDGTSTGQVTAPAALEPGQRWDVNARCRDLRDAGHSIREIASAVGLSRSTVARRLAA